MSVQDTLELEILLACTKTARLPNGKFPTLLPATCKGNRWEALFTVKND